MAQIQIYSDTNKGCIFFDGSTVEPKFIGTIVANIKPDEDRIVVKRTDRLESDGVTFRTLFKRLNPSRVQNEEGENLVTDLGYTTAQVVEYINGEANDFQTASAVQLTLDDTPNFTLDATSTTILIDNGDKHAVNSIKAILGEDGLIDIVSHGEGDITYYENIEPTAVLVNSSSVAGGPSDVVNTLNELFTMGAFESVVISDPYSTMVADVAGVDTGYTLEGSNAVDPVGSDIFTNTTTGNYAGLLSTETIDQAGEYFTFDIRGEGQIGFGLVHTQASYDAGHYAGNVNYANPTSFAVSNSAHYGFQFSHWFHPTPNGSWTNYGALTSIVYGSGWYNWESQDEWLAGENVKVKVAIDENGFIAISTLQDDNTTWVLHARSGYPVPQGSSFRLGIKSANPAARVSSSPKVHLLEPEAPTMQFRYIESPDGEFHYPLFATAEEANYYDEITNGLSAGTGASHTHTYADDPTGTTWYMAGASHDAGYTFHTSAPSATTFSGNTVTYTEVTSLTNADLTPTQFGASNITQEEGTNVNIQVTPAGATWSSSVSISPSGSGLVYDGYSLIQGTLADVGADTIYTITVTRANAYGSSVGTMTVTATNETPVQTNDTPWTKALDFSGSSEHLKQVGNYSTTCPLRMNDYATNIAAPSTVGNTAYGSSVRPWATAIVFKADRNGSNQHIWNQGEGSGSTDDNIYLRLDANGWVYFGWGRQGAVNECRFLPIASSSSGRYFGVYIASNGTRLSGSNATASNLAAAFDIRVITNNNNDEFNTLSSNLSTSTNWTNGSTGGRMDRSYTGDFTIGGRGSNRTFHGKVASMVVTTLRIGVAMPTDAEIELMITDPNKWIADYKVGNPFREPTSAGDAGYNWTSGNVNTGRATQLWLMGDGVTDTYANGIRNQILMDDQNATKLQLNSMVSNDIETVNIDGLT